jgi:hypothetical protein
VARAWHALGRKLPRGRRDALRQLALFALAYYLYRLVRGLIEGDVSTAFANARLLVDAERAMGLFFEPALQAWALAWPGLVDVASGLYVHSHFAITTGFLVWLYFRRNDDFYVVRDMFLVSMAIALAGYVLFPTAPPRMMPEWGFTDSVVELVGRAASQGAELLYNPFAAVPSMHVAFALMIGLPAARLVRSRVMKVVWCAYPLLVTFVVMVTANHFWLDAVLGALVAAFSAWVALAIQSSREAVGAEAAA